jgi:hypothetical protein
MPLYSTVTFTQLLNHCKNNIKSIIFIATKINNQLIYWRVRIGGYYNVVCGRTDDEADIAEVVYTGDWLDMQKKMTEFEVQLNSPVSSSL